jgi:hypothetical protein
MKTLWIAATLAAACSAGLAKLPAPVLDDAAKAKAAETAAKTAWQGKVDMYLLCRAQDRVAAAYRKGGGAAAAAPAAAPTAAATAAKAAASAASAAPGAAAAGTPSAVVGPAAIPGCADPGPFAYNAPEQKPLETSGAHSPAGTATSPPSVRSNSAEMAPAKK